MDEYLKLIVRLQALSQNGLAYVNNEFDKERYEEIRDIACQLMKYKTDLPFEKIKDLFGSEQGYQTPKIDTRAAIFKDNKILLVHENNDTWALPGGWCDTLESIKSNTIKEVNEETGLDVDAIKLIAVQDRNKHNTPIYAYGICKVFVLCKVVGGSFKKNNETIETNYFSLEDIPKNLANEKTTLEQIKLCFKANNNPNFETYFD